MVVHRTGIGQPVGHRGQRSRLWMVLDLWAVAHLVLRAVEPCGTLLMLEGRRLRSDLLQLLALATAKPSILDGPARDETAPCHGRRDKRGRGLATRLAPRCNDHRRLSSALASSSCSRFAQTEINCVGSHRNHQCNRA